MKREKIIGYYNITLFSILVVILISSIIIEFLKGDIFEGYLPIGFFLIVYQFLFFILNCFMIFVGYKTLKGKRWASITSLVVLLLMVVSLIFNSSFLVTLIGYSLFSLGYYNLIGVLLIKITFLIITVAGVILNYLYTPKKDNK